MTRVRLLEGALGRLRVAPLEAIDAIRARPGWIPAGRAAAPATRIPGEQGFKYRSGRDAPLGDRDGA